MAPQVGAVHVIFHMHLLRKALLYFQVYYAAQLPYKWTYRLCVHESCPRNPLIAKVFFLAGFIENWGRLKIHGANFAIAINRAKDACNSQNISTDDHFRNVTKKIEIGKGGKGLGEKVSNLTQKVTEQPQNVTEQVKKVTEQTEKVTEQVGKSNQADPKSNQAELKSNQVRLTAKQRKVLEFCDETPHTTQEILDMLDVQNQNKTRKQYTTKLVLAGVLRPTTVNRNDSNRKYITAHSNE